MQTDAFVAATRFGLGARPGELSTIAADPRGWLLAQLDGPDSTQAVLGVHAASTEVIRTFATSRMSSEIDKMQLRKQSRVAFQKEMADRCGLAAATDTPFRERWVRYWSNHFTVSTTRREVVGLAGPFEREAIRPHCTGRFADLLAAAELHPAMLLYLDNVRSVGPGSRAGRGGRRGLNENLAREILELHTLGVSGGYGQSDVEQLARILTGWSVDPAHGAAHFAAERHEPGRKTVLGHAYGDGPQAARAALDDLARHPSTARYVARRLARHFVADTPPPGAVDAIATTFRETDGDLCAVARTLVGLEAAWTPLTKVKSPEDLVLSTARGLGLESGEAMLSSLKWLGQEPFSATSPQGFPETAKGWLGPEALLSRIEWAEEIASQAAHRITPAALADDLLGSVLDRSTRKTIASASPKVGLALLLASPTFQRR
jgi:uncharacterized protein (DUF1800 family)